MVFPLTKQDDNWQLSRLRHESDDVIVELFWQNPLIKVVIETNKAISEKECSDLQEIYQEISQLLGQKRAKSLLNNWHEVSYRRVMG